MISEFKDKRHQQQAEEILLTLGKFTVQFERVCEAMRQAIIYSLRSQGLKNCGMEQVIIGDTSSAELQVLLGALCRHVPDWDDEDQVAIKAMLRDIKEITETRNIVIHSAWRFGNIASEADLMAVAVRQRTKQNSGAVPEIWAVTAPYLEELIQKMRMYQAQLQRLQICLVQSGHKPAKQLPLAQSEA